MGKLLDGLKMNNSSIIMGNLGILEESMLSLEASHHSIGENQVQKILFILAKYLKIKVRRAKLGQFSKNEKLIVGANLTKEIFQMLMKTGTCTFSVITFIFVFSVFLFVFSDVWLGIWIRDVLKFANKDIYLFMYGSVALSAACFVIIRDIMYRGR